MEAEEVGHVSDAGTSSAVAATASAGTEDSVMTNESTFDMPTEITQAGTDSQPPRPRVQYSTDLRKELSLDVLASLGDLAADDARPVDESILDLASVREDMDFISGLSSLGRDLDHATAPETFLPSSVTSLGEPHHGPDSAGAVITTDVSLPQSSSSSRISASFTSFRLEGLPGDHASLVAPGPDAVKSFSSHPCDDLSTIVPSTTSLPPVMNSTSSGADVMVENADPLSSVSPVTQSTDASTEMQSSRAREEVSEVASAGPPASENTRTAPAPSHLPVPPVNPSSVTDGNPATVEACHDSPKPSPSSPVTSFLSDFPPVVPVIASSPLESMSLDATEHLDSVITGNILLVALKPASLTSGDPAADFYPAPVVSPDSEMQLCTSADTDISEGPTASLESYPFPLETLPSVPADLPALNSPMPIENFPLESTFVPSGAAASGDDAVLASSPAFPSSPASVNLSFPNFSPALNSTPVQHDFCPPFSNTVVLDSSKNSSSSPATSALELDVPDITRAPFTPSIVPAKVPTFSDPVASPPLTARFWDVPSVSPGISLSVYFDGSRSSFRHRKINRKKRSSEAGADLKDMKGKGLGDVENLEEVAELESMLEAQKRVVKLQIDEIQRIATLQFQLTGSNPLSEQAMWEVLGVRGGGKKAGDALSPEALKSLQEMFALKDTLTKKEARDVSFTFGASLTQVRDYFAAQRSLVRKLVQQAHDEAGRLGIKNASEQSQQIAVSNSISEVEKDLGFDKLGGPESIEKIIEVMRAERGFAGQIQLLQVILRTDSAGLILRRFLEKGALKMLGGWLVEAVTEQQTSVISHLLKVLDHLPLSNAVSNQMAPLVHNVNKLRFYHASAVAGQARSLLTKWVKLLSPKTEVKSASSPGSKALAGSPVLSGGLKRTRDPPAAQVVPGTRKKKGRAAEVSQPESKASQIARPDSPSLNGLPQGASEHPSSSQPSLSPLPPPKPKWSSTLQPSESAVAAVLVSRKRLASKSLGEQPKDRRKVMRVEDNHIGKSIGSKPATILKTSRPLSTDDIYKAKKLERLMQEPILKSKRRAGAQEAGPQDVVPQTSAPKKPFPPAVPADIGAVKRETLNSSQGSWRGGALPAKSTQEDQPTATRTRLPIRSSVDRDVRTTITPTSSQDLFQTITPTSSQEQAHPASVNGGLTEDTAHKRDSNLTALIETHPLPSSVLGSSGQELSVSSHCGSSLQLPAGVTGSPGSTSAVSFAAASDFSHTIQSSQSFFIENNIMMAPMVKSNPAVFENVSPTPIEPSEARLEEASGLSVVRGVTNPFHKSAMVNTGSEVELGKGREPERWGNDVQPLPRETSLSDYYAVLRATMIRWRIPPVYQPYEQWNVAAGEDSKEREVQSGRVKREEEAYYPELSVVPDDPKDPWEEEPDYDDSLTLQIFVESEQRKSFTEGNGLSDISKSPVMNVVQYGPETSFGSDVSSSTIPSSALSSNHGQDPATELLSKAPTMNGLDAVLQQLSTGGGGTHDPDLLALLLRNPQLVSQLTSGQAFTPTSITNPGVFMQPLDPLKQLSSGGNNGAGLTNPAGDLGQERLIPSNNSKALGIPLQPGRSVSSVDQTPPETMRVQDSLPMTPHPGIGQQQTMGFTPRGGVDNRFLTPQTPSLVPRNIQDTSGWEHLRVPPPPPPVPPTQPVINQALQPPLPNQPNNQSNWHESQGWVGIGRSPLNASQTRSGPEQLLARQTLMTHNVRPPNYPGMIGVPQVELGPETSVNLPEVHHSQRPWLNGSHGGPTHENTMMHAGQDSGANRNNRWPRPPVRPTNQQVRSGNREFTDFNNSRQTTVIDNRSAWVQNERARAAMPPFQSAYSLPPPPPFPAPLWQGQEGNMRLVQGSAGNAFPHGRDLRPTQQQMWHNNIGPTSRQVWRGQQ